MFFFSSRRRHTIFDCDWSSDVCSFRSVGGLLAELLALEQSLVEQAANLAHDSSPRALARYGKDLERFEREGGYAVTARIDADRKGAGQAKSVDLGGARIIR